MDLVSSRQSPGSGSSDVPQQSRMQRSPQRLSLLESLPVEVLQKIFFECLEVNLPRASIHIARILSKPSIYTWLIRLAFSSANESSRHGFFTPDFLPSPLDFFVLSSAERSRLQTAILECRWSTLSLFRQCQRDYVKHTIRRKCAHLIFTPEDQQTLSKLDDFFARQWAFDEGRRDRPSKGDLVLTAKAPQSTYDLKVAFWFYLGAVQIREPSPVVYDTDTFHLPSCYMDAPARLPDKLLRRPWTPEKLEFLSLLSTQAYIDEDHTFSRARRVLRQVILDRDFATFERLLELSIRTKIYNYPQVWPVRTVHFRAALRAAEGPKDPFVALLYEKRWKETSRHEPAIQEAILENLGLNVTAM